MNNFLKLAKRMSANKCIRHFYLCAVIFGISVLFLFNSGCTKKVSTTTTLNQPRPLTYVTTNSAPLTYKELVKRFDKNGDGVLDENEIQQVQQQLKSAPPTFSSTDKADDSIKRALLVPGAKKSDTNDPILGKYDLNHDGILDEREVELFKADLRGETPALKKKPKPSQTLQQNVIKPSTKPIVR